MEIGEPVGLSAEKCNDSCPFCRELELKNYKTKHGALKDEKRLRANLRCKADITSEPGVGDVYPLSGGSDRTVGWEAKAGVFEDFPVRLAAAPHHLIPGKASMQPSRLEKWTVEGDKIIQDIGYNIDGAQNGIFLPHLPEIYWTKHKVGTETPQAQYYGATWSSLTMSSKTSISFIVMSETWLQMHYTDHDDPYVHVDNEKNYDDECKMQCNHLADLMLKKSKVAKCKDGDGRLAPPYELVRHINNKAFGIKLRITGNPARWSDFVSPLAQDLTHAIRTGQVEVRSKMLITQLMD